MRKQGQGVMQVNLAGIRRDVLNLAHNYSNAQKAVRKATSNDPWGPSSTLMAEIADLTYNVVAFTEIMQMLWKRLNDHGKNWRHVYKALVLLEYLIKTGSEKVAQQCKENIFAIQTLKDFQYMEGPKDQGVNVREKAKQLVALLKDDERLRNERARALKAKERFAQSVSGFGSDGLDAMSSLGDLCSPDWEPYRGKAESKPELEAARPQTVGEEELQLQLALAMSREEAEQEEQRRRSDDVRLQLALSQSQQDFKAPPSDKPSHMLDLLDVNLGEASGPAPQHHQQQQQQVDPWGVPIAPPASRPQPTNDPWSVPTATAGAIGIAGGVAAAAASATVPAPPLDPWAPVLPQRPTATVDPWRAPAPSPATVTSPARTADPWALPTTAATTSPTANAFSANNMNGGGANFNNFNSQGSTDVSPLGDLDEFDIISNRNKMGASPQPMNNEFHNSVVTSSARTPKRRLAIRRKSRWGTLSPDPFDLVGLSDNLPASTGAIKKTPQSFLGENSALVNLDNLVSASMIKPATPAPASNPFATTVTPPPRPSINQIRQDPWTGNGAATTANPFLS